MNKVSKRAIVGNIIYSLVAVLNVTVFAMIIVNMHRLYNYFTVLSVGRLIGFSLMILLPTIVSIVALIFYRRMEKRNRITSYGILFISIVFSFIFIVSMSVMSPFGSQTEDTENYLVFDEECAISGTGFSKLFPKVIPEKAENVKYFYRFNTYPDALYDVVAEWKLPRKEYEAEKKRVISEYSSIMHNVYGSYNCIYISSEEKTDYDYIFFAYNDDSCTLRYVVSYIDNVDVNGLSPYYETLEW